MKKNLLILGAGPRGLALAIQAIQHKDKFNIYIIDANPISTWKYPNMVVNMTMRSPITFDLVTYQKDLIEFRLDTFLGKKSNRNTQVNIEDNKEFCLRKEFVDYLEYCKSILLNNGVTFIKRKPEVISTNEIKFSNSTLKFDYLIVATGRETEKPNVPNYLKGLNLNTCSDMYSADWNKKKIYVVGSGQFSSEIVDYLTDNMRAQIYWVTKYNQKVEQYPVPSSKILGNLSALGTYYHKTCSIKEGQDYIKLVKNWGPTITPLINNKLEQKRNKFGIIDPKNIPLDKEAIYVLALGRRQDLYRLPLDFRLPSSIFREGVPYLTKNFNSAKYTNVYFTGMLAIEVGGPQQGSIISSGYTGEVIINSILSVL